ncbi:putative O-antigen transporter [compost metagenome]
MLSLGLLKSLDYIFPLAIIPLVIHSLGVSLYGVTSYYLSLSLLYVVIVDFGFNVYGVQKLALMKEDDRIKRFILSSFIIRFALLLSIVIPMHITLVHISPENMSLNGGEYIFLMIAVFNVFNLQWFFQVKEKFRLMICISLLFRLLALLLTFIFVKKESDAYIYIGVLILMYGGPYICHLIYFIMKYESVRMARLSKRYILALIKMSGSIFGYRIANAAILPCFNYVFGFLMTSAEFGVMSLVQRIFGAVINFSSPILQALIPFFADLKRKDVANFNAIYLKSFFYTLILSLLLSMFSIGGVYFIVYSGVLGGGIVLQDLFPHILMMCAIVPHVINSLQSQVLLLQNSRHIVNYAVLNSLLLVGVFFLIGFIFELTSVYFIGFYLATYYFMSSYLFWGGKR